MRVECPKVEFAGDQEDVHGIEIVNTFGSTVGLTMLSSPGITDDPHRRARFFPRFDGSAQRPFTGAPWGVRIAAAIGYPDERLGERICAVVALAPGARLNLDGLIAKLEQQGIARYLLPERLEVVASLPRNTTGKVLKRELILRLKAQQHLAKSS